MLDKFKTYYRKSIFNDSFLGFLVSPSFIARSSLYNIFKARQVLFTRLNVLDVGCGSKPYKSFFKDTKSYIGIDTNFSGHDHSDETIDISYDGKKLPLTDRSYDAIVSFQVLEHVEDEILFLTEINRVLVDNGILMMSFPFCWPEHEQPYDFRRLTSFGAKKLLEFHDFEVLELIKTTNYLQTILQLLNSYLASKLKTTNAVVNLIIITSFAPMINLMGFVVGKLSGNQDLFCDLVVIAKKREKLFKVPNQSSEVVS